MPATDRLRQALDRGPVLLDAAMGTRLIARGLDIDRDDPALWTVDRPEAVLDVHRLDIEAGADALLTNTFGANANWLSRFGRGDEPAAINRRAAALARRAGGPDRPVIGSIGPITADHPEALLEQARALAEGGTDALILETHRLEQAVGSLRRLGGLRLPVLVSLFAWTEPIGDIARSLIAEGAFAIGANCQTGMAPALALARRLRAVTDHPLILKPSAGVPTFPLDPPEVFEAAVPELLALGVGLIGGCCGTTEAHVAAMRRAIPADRAPWR